MHSARWPSDNYSAMNSSCGRRGAGRAKGRTWSQNLNHEKNYSAFYYRYFRVSAVFTLYFKIQSVKSSWSLPVRAHTERMTTIKKTSIVLRMFSVIKQVIELATNAILGNRQIYHKSDWLRNPMQWYYWSIVSIELATKWWNHTPRVYHTHSIVDSVRNLSHFCSPDRCCIHHSDWLINPIQSCYWSVVSVCASQGIIGAPFWLVLVVQPGRGI